jgi:hypothetical protein
MIIAMYWDGSVIIILTLLHLRKKWYIHYTNKNYLNDCLQKPRLVEETTVLFLRSIYNFPTTTFNSYQTIQFKFIRINK